MFERSENSRTFLLTSHYVRRVMELTLIITIGILIGCFVGLSWFAGSDAPFVPTKNSRIKKILKIAGVKKGKTFWELGSGDGRVVLKAAKMGATSYGVEQSWLRVLWSRWQARSLASHIGSGNVKFIHGDIFRQDFSNADFVFIFLLPKGVEKLEALLKSKLKKKTKVITQTFHFKNWQPIKKVLVTEKAQPNTLLGKDKYEGDFRIYQV